MRGTAVLKSYFRYLGPAVVLAILAGALGLLCREIRRLDLNEVVQGIRSIPPLHVAAAIGLTVLNYMVLICYDLLNIRYLGHPFPVKKIALASLISYMVSNTFGMLLGGTSVRYRLYSTWGLSAVEVVELIALLGLTFWLGVFALAGFLFVAAPFPVPDVLQPWIHVTSVVPIGVALLAFVGVYLAASAFWRRPIGLLKWRSQLPPLRVSLYQILISSTDITVAGGVFYVLLPPNSEAGFLTFLGVYLLAVVAAVITHVPGQFGVLDLVILVFYSAQAGDQSREAIAAALAVYRAVYTFFPLMIAALLMGLYELSLQKARLKRWLGVQTEQGPSDSG